MVSKRVSYQHNLVNLLLGQVGILKHLIQATDRICLKSELYYSTLPPAQVAQQFEHPKTQVAQ